MRLPLGQAYLTPWDAVVRVQDFGALDVYQPSTVCTESFVSRTIGTPAAIADAGMSFRLRPPGYIGSLPFICPAGPPALTGSADVHRYAMWPLPLPVTLPSCSSRNTNPVS